MRPAAWDAWVAKARSVRIEDECSRRGIVFNGQAVRLSAAAHVPNAAARIGLPSTRRSRSSIAADVARAAT